VSKLGTAVGNRYKGVKLILKKKEETPQESEETCEASPKPKPCPGCDGKGKYVGFRWIEDPCEQCGGSGEFHGEKAFWTPVVKSTYTGDNGILDWLRDVYHHASENVGCTIVSEYMAKERIFRFRTEDSRYEWRLDPRKVTKNNLPKPLRGILNSAQKRVFMAACFTHDDVPEDIKRHL